MHTNMEDNVFVATNVQGDNKHDDDTSGEFERVETCWRDAIGNTDPGVSETVFSLDLNYMLHH